jgi:hypothetical protein
LQDLGVDELRHRDPSAPGMITYLHFDSQKSVVLYDLVIISLFILSQELVLVNFHLFLTHLLFFMFKMQVYRCFYFACDFLNVEHLR